MKYCTESEPPCPLICLEKLVFEMDKSFRETRLQLLLSPVLLKSADYATDRSPGPPLEPQLRQGHLLLTGLQFRGHAMFSELDRDLGAETLEYGWLMALQCGSLLGKITVSQLYSALACLETLAYLLMDKENVMKHPRPYKLCQHDVKQTACRESSAASLEDDASLCPTVGEV